MQSVIYGLAGTALTDEERDFFKEADPAGYILFGRNVEDRGQLSALTESLKELHGRARLPILIDQEGGRVSRLAPPNWPAFPPMGVFAKHYEKNPRDAEEAAKLNARAIGIMLSEVGITVDALPVLDVRQEGADEIVGDRALGTDPVMVGQLGDAVIKGLHSGGVVSIVKHMPGHGRALVDSHKERPLVTATAPELDIDLAPFEKLAHAPMGMVAHIVYSAWDPDYIASQSSTVIEDIIRGRLGFDGWLISDDLNMAAMTGSMAERAIGVIYAGCDVALHCSGKMDEMRDVAEVAPTMTPRSVARMQVAMALEPDFDPMGFEECIAKRDELLGISED